MLRGLTTIRLVADDVLAAAAWYTELLGVEPYFKRDIEEVPAYVEFRIGDYQHELGIANTRFVPHTHADKTAGTLVYWHVDDVQGTLDRLLSLGATVHEPLIERGPGFVTASVIDPFGNVLGVMYNQHYLDILGTRHIS
ncbi:VOC family protein [Phytohabitans aurantiacus]|jgi:predicted enzyme related to lactoylglutathione lyase|uniref:Glyoxalase n=1 Tax=Phytohabitans aurantiacus TaxID=3016789 RepID=A0ABQ5QPF6_9ACTN|nr:VOC family protein [Phytohabitans aurantiacus]GLH96536.1 glyoxalase [Phytohabitans aurantiacus]